MSFEDEDSHRPVEVLHLMMGRSEFLGWTVLVTLIQGEEKVETSVVGPFLTYDMAEAFCGAFEETMQDVHDESYVTFVYPLFSPNTRMPE